MGFREDLGRLSDQIKTRLQLISGEEATKQALILPFLAALGYDIYHPSEVQPEYAADFAKKKSGQFEKVDYAIYLQGNPIIFLEAKASNVALEKHDTQLARYFNTHPNVKVGILSNGVQYLFFSDLQEPNIMDTEPFFSFDIVNYSDVDVEFLKPFQRSIFNAETVVQHAEEIIYVEALNKTVKNLLKEPSESFIKFLLGEANLGGRMTAKVIGRFQPMVKKAIQAVLVELMTRSIQQEIGRPEEEEPAVSPESVSPTPDTSGEEKVGKQKKALVTTPEEHEAFAKIKELLGNPPDLEYTDTVNYFTIHRGSSHKWVVRLFMDAKRINLVCRLPVEKTQELSRSFEAGTCPPQFGTSRVYFEHCDRLVELLPLLKICYEAALTTAD